MSDMLEGWRSVEEGGKSLKEACERLLEEKVRRVFRSYDKSHIFIGPITADDRRSRYATAVFPGVGAGYPDAQSPWRLIGPSNRLLVHGRACGYLHRLFESSRWLLFSLH